MLNYTDDDWRFSGYVNHTRSRTGKYELQLAATSKVTVFSESHEASLS